MATVEDELKSAFVAVAGELNDKVKSTNGLKGIWVGLREEWEALPTKDNEILYVIRPPAVM